MSDTTRIPELPRPEDHMAPNLPPLVGAEVPFTLGDLLTRLAITWPCSKKDLLEKVQQAPDPDADLIDRSAMLPLLSKIPDREYQDGADVEPTSARPCPRRSGRAASASTPSALARSPPRCGSAPRASRPRLPRRRAWLPTKWPSGPPPSLPLAVSPGPKKSPTSSCSWQASVPATSPAQTSSSMAASSKPCDRRHRQS